MLRTETATLQRANRFKSSEHANHAVIFSSVWDCINVGACSHRRRVCLGTRPSRENISAGILAYSKPSFFAESNEPSPRLKIRWRKNNSCYGGRLRFGDQCQLFDLRCQTVLINFEIHRAVLASGWRFESL